MRKFLCAPRRSRTFERFLASLALIVCIVTVARLWQVIDAYQPLWLFPALYFLEMGALGFAAWLALVAPQELASHHVTVVWCVVGAMIGFSILAMFSVGIYFLPVAFLFALTALFAERRHLGWIPMHLAFFFLAGLAQAAIILLFASLR